MKIALCIDYLHGKPVISKYFGKSEYFLIYDIDKEVLIDKLANHIRFSVGSEVFCAQMLIKYGINMVVCGICESDSKKLFLEANIELMENIQVNPSSLLSDLFLLNKKQVPDQI